MSQNDDLLDNSLFSTIFSLLMPSKREEALEKLTESGLINESSIEHWKTELSDPRYNERTLNMVLAPLKIMVSRMSEKIGGETESNKTRELYSRLVFVLHSTGNLDFINYETITNRSFMDFGAGVYSTASNAIVLYANGYARAVAYEPFPIDVDFAVESVAQTIKWLHLRPDDFIFSGISKTDMKRRLADLDFSDVEAQMNLLNQGKIQCAKFGGVEIMNSLPEGGHEYFDVISSNSVLEHVQDLEKEMIRQHEILKTDGVCVHTVDFSDHRAINARDTTHVFQMYYDGVLMGINGLRPSEMEEIFARSGFAGNKINFVNTPAGYVSDFDRMLPRFARFSPEELSVWVNSYVLTKRPS